MDAIPSNALTLLKWGLVAGILGVILDLVVCSIHRQTAHEFFAPHYYEEAFPEEKFKPPKSIRAQYLADVEAGRVAAKTKTVVVCGICRNLGDRLERTMRLFETIGSCFADYRVVVFENDSSDDTRRKLVEWSRTDKHQRVDLIRCSCADDCYEECAATDCRMGVASLYHVKPEARMEKMASFRNKVRERIAQRYAYADYVVVADMDLAGSLSIDGFLTTFAPHKPSWDAVCANGLFKPPGLGSTAQWRMYDTLAFVSIDEEMPTKPRETAAEVAHFFMSNTKRRRRGQPWIPVKSGFGGLTVYSTPAFIQAEYDGGICEHIGLHQNMLNHGHGAIFINPSMILLSGYQGPSLSTFFGLGRK